MKNLKTLITLFLLVMGTVLSFAETMAERTATWDFQSMAKDAVNIQGATGKVDSNVEGVSLEVDATSGKLWSRGGDAQFNDGTVINVPVRSAGDVVTVVSYPDYHFYTIGGSEATKDTEKYIASASDANTGYVSVAATGGAYLFSISVKQIAADALVSGLPERTATWNFKTMAQNDVYIQSAIGEVNSDVEGVSLDVDATNNGKLWSRGGDAQFNQGTIINVPVRSVGDIVTVVSYPGYHNYTIAGKDAKNDTEKYAATEADVTAGYVSVAATGGAYLYSISVKQIRVEVEEPTVEERTAIWNWKTAASNSAIMAETNVLARVGTIHSNLNGVVIVVDATKNGRFDAYKSGNVNIAQMSEGVIIKVPVQHDGDIVTVESPANQFNYTVAGVKAKAKTTVYNVTEEDAQNGFILIEATGNNAKLYSISVKQLSFKSELPKIKLNSTGWASFTSLMSSTVVQCPIGTTAYVATEADGETVTLTEVTKFTFGQGVFLKGDPNAEIYPVATSGAADVPTQAEGNITEGCIDDVELFTESGAYVVATNNATGEAGFFRVTGNNIIVPAGKAYLYGPLDEDSKVGSNDYSKMLKIVFANGEEATGIESVIATKAAPTVFYNLSGQKVGKNYKGVVIGNDGAKYVK